MLLSLAWNNFFPRYASQHFQQPDNLCISEEKIETTDFNFNVRLWKGIMIDVIDVFN